MNREEFIAEFRAKVLPKYMEMVKEEPYIPPKVIQPIDDKPAGYYATKYHKCRKCGELKPITEFYGRYRTCKTCKNKYQMHRYYGKKVEYYEQKLNEYE